MTTPSLIAGRYRLDVALATGGMGVVWRGWDERLQRDVAIKQLRLQPGLSPAEAAAARDRALREARITARLHHPNAVPIYDVVEHDGEPCLIMQFLPSVSLQATLQRRGTLPLIDVARIGSEIAAALTAAHRVGIVHRDVKPGNVLIVADGSAKLTDFGISHAMGDASLTSTGMVTGTPAYLAPEVARGEPATFASDVFSLGATLYTAAEGTPPFEPSDNPMALLHRVASGHVRPPTRSGALTSLLTRMLAADPQARPSMTEAWVDLTSLHASSSMDAPEHRTQVLPPRTAVQPSDPERGAAERGVAARPVRAAPVASTLPEPVPVPKLLGRDRSAGAVRRAGAAALVPAAGTEVGERDRHPSRAWAILVGLVALALLALALIFVVPKLGGSNQPGGGSVASSTHSARTLPASSRTASSRTASASSAPSHSASATHSAAPTRSATTSATTSGTASATSTPSSVGASTTSTAPSTSTRPAATTTSSRSTTAAATTSASANAATGSTSTRLARAVTDYYALVPGNLDAGYALLTPNYQNSHAGGYNGYRSFWSKIRSVSADNVTGSAPDTATATVTYRYASGRTVVERTRYRFQNSGGQLLIAGSSVLSSHSS